MTFEDRLQWGRVPRGRVFHIVVGGRTLCGDRPCRVYRVHDQTKRHRECVARMVYNGAQPRWNGPLTIYLLHFDRPFGHARHYLGITNDLASRMVRHTIGRGSRFMEAVGRAGIGWRLARTWRGTRADERRLKNRGSGARLCPICRGEETSQP